MTLTLMSHAQDIHFTDFRLHPLAINPAQTGAFHGTARIGAIYRDQYRPFISQAFQTSAFYVDSPIMYGLKENHWIGVGLSVFSDKAGDIGYKSVGTHLHGAYHLGLDKEMTSVITLGARYGQVMKSVTQGESAIFGDELADPNISSLDRAMIEDFSRSFSDVGLGLLFKAQLNDRSGIQLGVSLDHLIKSSKSRGLVNQRWNMHATYSYDVSSRFRVDPTLYYYQEQTTQIFVPQINTAYHVNPEKTLWLRGGIGYRTNDAIQFLLGATFNDWTVGLSYDLTISQAAEATDNFGALELGVNKILKLYKEPEVDPIILCPRF